jgi:hypothetical protein
MGKGEEERKGRERVGERVGWVFVNEVERNDEE